MLHYTHTYIYCFPRSKNISVHICHVIDFIIGVLVSLALSLSLMDKLVSVIIMERVNIVFVATSLSPRITKPFR